MKLRPYQAYACQQIIDKPACALFLDMGLGKTLTTLTAIDELINERFEVGRVLVIAPLRVAETTWPDEVQKWGFDLKVVKILGCKSVRRNALQQDADVFVINRENVPWLCENVKDWPFDMVVIDESSSFKNPQAKRFKCLKRIRPLIRRLVLLTGTPTPNGLMDLWSQMYLVDRGARLGKTIGKYRERWFYPGSGYGHVVYEWVPKEHAHEEIYEAISDVAVSMKSEDYLSLPPVIKNEVHVKLDDWALYEYKKLERELVLSIKDKDIVAATAAALSNKLLQFANGFCYDESGEPIVMHGKKLDALQEIIEDNEHKNVMVFYWFKEDLAMLKGRFPKARELKTADDVRAWNAGKVPLLLVHPASAGHGLNLQQGGSLAVWYSMTWSLELYQQANKRLHRSGQEHTVVIHHLVADGTMDAEVMKALESKREGQDGLLEAIKARIREYGGWRWTRESTQHIKVTTT